MPEVCSKLYVETFPDAPQDSNICLCYIYQNLSRSCPIGSMYGIFTYIYHKNPLNVGKYTIHGSYECSTIYVPFILAFLDLPEHALFSLGCGEKNMISVKIDLFKNIGMWRGGWARKPHSWTSKPSTDLQSDYVQAAGKGEMKATVWFFNRRFCKQLVLVNGQQITRILARRRSRGLLDFGNYRKSACWRWDIRRKKVWSILRTLRVLRITWSPSRIWGWFK